MKKEKHSLNTGAKQASKPPKLGPKALRRRLSALPIPKRLPPNKRYSPAEEDILVARSRLGDRVAGEMLLVAFDESIKRCAKRWFFAIHGHDLELDDVVQVARMGCMRAIEKYERSAGNLEAYVLIWGMQCAVRAIQNEGYAIRVPVHKHQALSVFERAQTIADQQPPPHLVDVAMAKRLARLDEPLRGDKYIPKRDTIAGGWKNAEETFAEDERKRVVVEAAQDLRQGMTPLDRAILDKRLLTDDPIDLAEIGRMCNRSRERARQRQITVMSLLKRKIKQHLEMSDVR